MEIEGKKYSETERLLMFGRLSLSLVSILKLKQQ